MKRRAERLSDLVKQEISLILFQKMKDPRLKMCSITDVVLSKDYRHARIFVSAIGTPQHRDECVDALNAAVGFIRHELRRLDLRYIPSLTFVSDTGAEYSQHIEELLKSVKKEDSET